MIMFDTNIDYEKTAEMRITMCIRKIQECTSMASFVEAYKEELEEWQNYYITIKKLHTDGEFERLFEIPLPNGQNNF